MSDINDLMDLDPYKCTKSDISALIHVIRQGRATWNLGAKDPASKTARAKPAIPKVKVDLSSLLKKKPTP